ncbi:MAG: helix-turn-helix domain-containing protein [Pseudomonadota bacterium]
MNPSDRTPDISRLNESCARCQLNRICLPRALGPDAVEKLDGIIKHSGRFNRGSHLYRQGTALHSLYIIKTGWVKNYLTTADGTEQILGFYLPCDLLGLDGLEQKRHTSSSVALDLVSVCELPYEDLDDLCRQLPLLDEEIKIQLCRELSHQHVLILLMAQKKADERLAIFLLSLSFRLKALRRNDADFDLPMSHAEIGNFLGMAPETVSRILGRIEENGIIKMDGKRVQIMNLPQLCRISPLCDNCSVELAH